VDTIDALAATLFSPVVTVWIEVGSLAGTAEVKGVIESAIAPPEAWFSEPR
jgi:hypothetical protein